LKSYDVAIVGAGPAGASAALSLHGSNLSVALIDKSEFPRDKICGDALSPDVVNQLNMLPLDTGAMFDQFEEKIWCKAVRFVSPNFSHADVSLNQRNITGYVSPRIDFDQFMYSQAIKSDGVTPIIGSGIKNIQRNADGLILELASGEQIKANVVLGADGANSAVARCLSEDKMDKNHHCAGLRQYYEGVTGFSEDNAVELHFYKDLLPGYFWVFPLPGNRANVGIGMLSSFVSKRKPNLKKKLKEIIEDHPNIRDRFKDATALEEVKGFGLPLGSKKRNLSGDRFLLLGDAASLINPLSGEGIANAIRSGRVAADYLKSASGNYSGKSMKAYDREIYRRMWGELRLNYWIQIAMRNPTLCNFIVKRAIGNSLVQDLVISGFSAEQIRARFKR
jgi:menaquinone-9 beta-reductase